MDLAIRRISGSRRGILDGVVNLAYFDTPTCVSCASNGDIWVVDKGNVRVRRIVEETVVTSLTGTRASPYQVSTELNAAEGVAADTFTLPIHLAHGRNNEVFVVDYSGDRVRKMANGTVYTVIQGTLKKYMEGFGGTLMSPRAVQIDPFGDLWLVNTGRKEILHTPNVNIGTLSKGAQLSWRNTTITPVPFDMPFDVAFSPFSPSSVYVADGNRIKIMDRTKLIPTVYAGDEMEGFLDGIRQNARFSRCTNLLMVPNGDILVSDELNHAIRRVSLDGMVTTFAGSADSAPTIVADIFAPGGLCWNRNGDLIIPDSGKHLILAIDMAFVPLPQRIQLESALELDRKISSLQLTHHASGRCWTIIHPAIALASLSLCNPESIITHLEQSQFSAESIEIVLSLLLGSYPSLPSHAIALEVLELLIDLKLFEIISCSQSLFASVFQKLSDTDRSDLMEHLNGCLRPEKITIQSFVMPMLNSHDEAPPLLLTPPLPWNSSFFGSGLLRIQLERLYWSTIGFPELGDCSARPHLPHVPDVLKPNLELVTVDGSVMCHDWVLCARWRFVKNMFLFSGEEVQSRSVSLEDVGITRAALQYIVYFMYTDRLDLLTDESLCLSILKWHHELHLADFDDTPIAGCEKIIQHCTKPFSRPLSMENAVSVYRAAVEGGSKVNEQRVLSFISRNLKAMMASDRRYAELKTLPLEILASIMFGHFGRAYTAPETPTSTTN